MRFVRVALLMVVAACVALAAITLWKRGGVTYVNLDSVLQDSRVFDTCRVAPVAIATVCLVASTLPRIVAITVAVTVALRTAFEMGARLLVPAPAPVHGEPKAEAASAFYVRDATLGHVPARSATAHHRRRIGDTQIYDVTDRTDARGSYLDDTRLIDSSDPQYRLAELDYHNSAKANRIIARRLVADLIHATPRGKEPRGPEARVSSRNLELAHDDVRHGH